jgi:hypothetical protein
MNIRQFASAAELCYEAEIRRFVPKTCRFLEQDDDAPEARLGAAFGCA